MIDKLLTKTLGEEIEEWKKHLLPDPESDLKRFMEDETPVLYFMSLIDLPHVELRNVLIEMLPQKYYELLSSGSCSKKYSNDKPYEAIISYYDSIIIGWTGIYYKPEHGERKKLLEGFTLGAILKYFSKLNKELNESKEHK